MNKKKLIGWIVGGILALGTIGGGTAGIIIATHEHSYSTEWTYDEVNHWHEATCSHKEEVSGLEAHTFDSGVVTPPSCTAKGYTTYTCTVCGATKTGDVTDMLPHVFDEGETTFSTCTTQGGFTKTCTVCGGKDTTPFAFGDHSFNLDWVITDTHHYRTASCVHSSEISRMEEHTYLTYYEDENGTITKHEECNICHHKKTETTLVKDTDYIEYTYADATAENGLTLSSPNTIYVLVGDYEASKTFTLNAENITVIGSRLTSSNPISFKLTESSNGAVIYGFKENFGNLSNIYSSVTMIDCNMNYDSIKYQAPNCDVVIDNCYMTGYNALYVQYFTYTPNCTLTVTNSTIDKINAYAIFLRGDDGSKETGFPTLSKIVYENNKHTNGWGRDDNKPKRAVFKIHHDQSLALGDTGDTTDTSKLTAGAKQFAEYILTSNNTFDSAGYNVSIFNFDNIYFSDVDWKYWPYE